MTDANELPVYYRSVLGKHFEAIGIMRRKQYSWRKIAEILASHFYCTNENGSPLSYGFVFKWYKVEQKRRRNDYVAEIRKEVKLTPVVQKVSSNEHPVGSQPFRFRRKS